MELHQLKATVDGWARHYGVDPMLARAIAEKESAWKPEAVRFEPAYSWLYSPDTFAGKLGISLTTERALQRFSYGPMQVMGAVCRELGFDDSLALLPSMPSVSINFGVLHLANLRKRFPGELDLIAAYNAGSPRRGLNGEYVNQAYVDGVSSALQKLRSGVASGNGN